MNRVCACRVAISHLYPVVVYDNATALMKVKEESGHTPVMIDIDVIVPNLNQGSNIILAAFFFYCGLPQLRDVFVLGPFGLEVSLRNYISRDGSL